MQLAGRQSKVLLTDYAVGARSSLLYSTAEALFAGALGGVDTVLLVGDADQGHEFALADGSTHTIPPNSPAGLRVVVAPRRLGVPLVLFADSGTAATVFAPPVLAPGASTKNLKSFWQFGTNETVLVAGPQLVRNASAVDGGRTLALRGDLNGSAPLTLVVPASVTAATWNGARVALRALPGAPSIDGLRMLQGELQFGKSAGRVKVPVLQGWRFMDSLPEVKDGYDDSGWVTADHTTTNISAPLFGDGRVLYGACRAVQLLVWRAG